MKISAAESQIMDALWRLARPAPLEDVVTALGDQQEWSAGTVRTFLTRLVAKKAVGTKKDGRRHLYSPLLDRAAFLGAESGNIVDRLFGGQLAPFVASFAEHRALDAEDIARLKKLIAELEK